MSKTPRTDEALQKCATMRLFHQILAISRTSRKIESDLAQSMATLESVSKALAELVAATREKWRDGRGSFRQYNAVIAAAKLLKK
jgi:hypothetical protein